jgi:hypothetical protein
MTWISCWPMVLYGVAAGGLVLLGLLSIGAVLGGAKLKSGQAPWRENVRKL